jgi:hypothetical protein
MATRLPRTQPLAVREDPCVREARELLVFLPGVFDVVEDYEAHGFLRAVRETGRAVDMLRVDAHMQLVDDRVLVPAGAGSSRPPQPPGCGLCRLAATR